MQERDHQRNNNISVCWDKLTRESITHQYAGMRINTTLVWWNEVA